MLEAIVKNTGPIEIVINNTGGAARRTDHGGGPTDFEKAFRAHILASQSIMRTVLPA